MELLSPCSGARGPQSLSPCTATADVLLGALAAGTPRPGKPPLARSPDTQVVPWLRVRLADAGARGLTAGLGRCATERLGPATCSC